MTRALGGTLSSCAPELLPEDTLSVSDDAESSPPSNDARRVPSSNTIDCCSKWTVARMEPFFSKLQSKLLIKGFDWRGLAAGQRWWFSKGREFSDWSLDLAGVAAAALVLR